jgi:hypothetical protein
MEFAFYQYIVHRQLQGYSFEQAINIFLADENINAVEKQTEWVNTARNHLITNQTNLNPAAQIAYTNAQIAYNNAQIAFTQAQIGNTTAQIGNNVNI